MKNVKYGQCIKCGKTYDAVADLTTCTCGGILDIVYDYDYIKTTLTKEKLANRDERTMWRYRELAGKAAVENAVNGISDKMVGFERIVENGKYICKTKLLNLTDVANTEQKVPLEWINAAGNNVEQPFIEYALPLIQGEPKLPKQDSLPRFAKLKKVLAK